MLAPYSSTLNRVLAELGSESASLVRVAGLIEKDAVLAGEVLGRANSCLYQRRSPVTSMRHAVALLGIEKVRNVALGFSVTRLCTRNRLPPGFSQTAFRQHSSAVALMAGLLEQRLMPGSAESAFSAGLFHDISKLLVALSLPQEFKLITENGHWDNHREQEILGVTHAELSANVIERWRLAADVQEAVALHHTKSPQGSEITLADLLGVADDYAEITHDPNAPSRLNFDQSALGKLGIGDQIPSLVAEFSVAFEESGNQTTNAMVQ